MPVTKTAKRALMSSKRKASVNNLFKKRLEIAIRSAKKSKTTEKISGAIALADRAAKKKIIHKNKASRIKSILVKLLSKDKSAKITPKAKKPSSKK